MLRTPNIADDTLPESPQGVLCRPGSIVADRYHLLRILGRGGMGEVWEARHEALGRSVALKLVRVDVQELRAQLLHEARVLASLRHPAIVTVHDAGITKDGVAYLAMDVLTGQSLANLISRERLDVRSAVALAIAWLDGLAVAHAAGILHRDIKPDNIVLVRGDDGLTPVLIDFGISVPVDDPGSTHRFAGTPQYMSPEQLRGERCDERTDVWACCVTLYEAITGRSPFEGPDFQTTAQNVAELPLPFPADVSTLDGRLWKILTRGLRKGPVDRTASARQLKAELVQWADQQTQRTTSPPATAAPAAPPRAPAPDASTQTDALIRRKFTES